MRLPRLRRPRLTRRRDLSTVLRWIEGQLVELEDRALESFQLWTAATTDEDRFLHADEIAALLEQQDQWRIVRDITTTFHRP